MLKSNTSLLACVIPFPASRLAGIQIAQINDLEFLESWIQTMCSFLEGFYASANSNVFLKKDTHTHTRTLFCHISHC